MPICGLRGPLSAVMDPASTATCAFGCALPIFKFVHKSDAVLNFKSRNRKARTFKWFIINYIQKDLKGIVSDFYAGHIPMIPCWGIVKEHYKPTQIAAS